MTLHLSQQEMLEVLATGTEADSPAGAGDGGTAGAEAYSGASPGLRAHLAECEPCRLELARIAQATAVTREKVKRWVARQQSGDAQFLRALARRGQQRRRLQLAQVAAAALLVAALPGVWIERRHAEQARRAADEVLLRQVDMELSQTAPDAFEPLNRLVVWEEEADGAATRNRMNDGTKTIQKETR